MAKRDSSDFVSLHSQCETWVRAGEIEKARGVLRKLEFDGIPRAQLPDFCNLARRVQLHPLSLRALRPYVRPKLKTAAPARPLEKIEYALALRHEGAFAEAKNLLEGADLNGVPRAVLARAFGFMHDWDYENALQTLGEFLRLSGLSEYEERTALVNQLACLRFLGRSDFAEAFAELAPRLEKNKNYLLLANCLEMQAQFFIDQERWAEAQKVLERAQKLIDHQSLSSHFVEKWMRVLRALKAKDSQTLEQFRVEALKRADWETLRDLDYHQAQLNPESDWATNVYYGTPFPSFRKRLEKLRDFEPEAWIGRPGRVEHKFDPWFPGDMEGELPHSLLLLLLRDLYRPAMMGEIFFHIYPDQFFDLDSSATRVRQLVARLRKWVTKNELPLSLTGGDAGYGVRLKAGARILFRKRHLGLEKFEILFGRFRDEDPGALSAQDWAKKLQMPAVKLGRIVKEATDAGVLTRQGQSRYTVYRLKY